MSAARANGDQPQAARGPGGAIPNHGLFHSYPPPSREVLLDWVEQNGGYVHPELRIADMDRGTGWRLVSEANLDMYDLLFSIPKTSLLSTRTSSLPPLPLSSGPITNVSILHLALCLLHELRLAAESPFYGYLQALPRDTRECLLPMFWHISELAGGDGKDGLSWLKGTEVERRMESKAREGLAYSDIVKFYSATASLLPPAPSHPEASPLLAFIHAYSLIVTRAFVIDLYRPTALVPFADLLNHSSNPHTSLASDEFVCHTCGSMGRCTHDILDPSGLPYRLGSTDMSEAQKRKMAEMRSEREDTVELRAEKPIREGEEVWNSYGEIGDAGLLAEWGFVGGDYVGPGLLWDVEEVGEGSDAEEDDDDNVVRSRWAELLDGESKGTDTAADEEEDGQGLISPSPALGAPPLLNLSLSGRLSYSLFLLIYLHSILPDPNDTDKDTRTQVESIIAEIEVAFEAAEARLEKSDDQPMTIPVSDAPPTTSLVPQIPTLSPDALICVEAVLDLLKGRLGRSYRSELAPVEILQLRDSLPLSAKCTRMAMTVTADERSLLFTTILRWEDLLG